MPDNGKKSPTDNGEIFTLIKEDQATEEWKKESYVCWRCTKNPTRLEMFSSPKMAFMFTNLFVRVNIYLADTIGSGKASGLDTQSTYVGQVLTLLLLCVYYKSRVTVRLGGGGGGILSQHHLKKDMKCCTQFAVKFNRRKCYSIKRLILVNVFCRLIKYGETFSFKIKATERLTID